MIDKIKHFLGICNKSRAGYKCRGRNNYQECA